PFFAHPDPALSSSYRLILHFLTSPRPPLSNIPPPPEHSPRPVGENATEVTSSVCPRNTPICLCVRTSQTLAVPSALPVASICWSLESARARIASWWPVRIDSSL